MIILDTNVICELMKSSPHSRVLSWLERQETRSLFLTSITIAEIYYGLSVLPLGKKRTALSHAFQAAVLESFEGRVFSFDDKAAQRYGEVMAKRRKLGKPLAILDGQISAIAHSRKAQIATRNVLDFSECGIEVINPFNFCPEI